MKTKEFLRPAGITRVVLFSIYYLFLPSVSSHSRYIYNFNIELSFFGVFLLELHF